MKIICPECQAAYEIDVPESPTKDLSAKCAVCNSKFPIKKRGLAKSSHAQDSMTGPPLAQIDSESALESTEDLLSGLEMGPGDFGELHLDHEESSDDKHLDDYLDQLLEEGFDEPDKEILDESAQQLTEDSTPPVSETPSEEDLDRLFDSLIAEEIKSPIAEEDSTGSDLPSENDQEDMDLDAILDEIILNNLDEEEAVDPKADFDETESTTKDSELLTKENEEIDAPVVHPMEDSEQKIETPEPESPGEEDLLEKDALAESPPEEETLSTEDEPQDSKETAEDPQITAEAEPSADQQEEEKNDEDQWAEALADQEALKESAEDGDAKKISDEPPETVDPNEEKSAVETAEAEPSADQQEEEKDDEDLWAEALADQEALKESAEDGDAEKISDEPPETVDPNEEEGAEETAEAEAAIDSDEETSSTDEEAATDEEADSDKETSSTDEEAAADEEADSDKETSSTDEEENSGAEADSEEEPETTVFGLSEADYENDDDVSDKYDQFGEHEESSASEKKKFAFFTLPSTKTGKLVLGGGVLAVLLTSVGAYFALQTLAPPELTQMTKNTSAVPEGLKPKDPQEDPAFPNQSGNAPAEKPNPALAAALGAGTAPPLAKDTGNPNTPAEAENSSGAGQGLVSALAPSNHAVQLGAIMPVAYNINDIRVLSFSLEAEMSDAESAQVIREALPVFEKITITTVEQLMDKKFFNDILYVKEKLKKNLQNNFNKTLQGGGRVKKITFKDFTVQ